MGILKMSARALVLVFALNLFLCSGQFKDYFVEEDYDYEDEYEYYFGKEDNASQGEDYEKDYMILKEECKIDAYKATWDFNYEILIKDLERGLCDQITDRGGWIIIQKRYFGQMSFHRNWNQYKHGFGSAVGDFWIGNDLISNLTSEGYNELRFDMTYKGKDYYAVYRGFKVENETAKYRMIYTSFSGGNVKDDLKRHNGSMFTTMDNDNDKNQTGNCAVESTGGWWFKSCQDVNINGKWKSREWNKCIMWKSLTGRKNYLEYVYMKVRRM